ncbi:MAG: bifunctional hydroxymethylpyrimidine kinase/phosphomethylpyrimidine kinase [Pseudomonadota bacterium]
MISSFTASSHVGSVVSAFVLRRMGIDVTVLPTTLFGRHPGWGVPGGAIVPIEQLKDMWAAIRDQMQAQSFTYDAIMTGYMGCLDHVTLAASIIDDLKPATVLVDPVMGDGSRTEGGLYIPGDRAEAICDLLVPRATITTPNLWEWRYITGNLSESADRLPSALTGVDETLVTSVSQGDQIGAMLFTENHHHQTFHDRFDGVPNGGGDTLAAAYLGQRLRGVSAKEALGHSVSAVFAIMREATRTDAGELPLIRAQNYLDPDGGAPELTVEAVS